jgi:hypothetical protein
MSNGYHEGLVCEHVYALDGSRCGEPAVWILWGMGLCDDHFEDRVRGSGCRAGELRAAVQAVPA